MHRLEEHGRLEVAVLPEPGGRAVEHRGGEVVLPEPEVQVGQAQADEHLVVPVLRAELLGQAGRLLQLGEGAAQVTVVLQQLRRQRQRRGGAPPVAERAESVEGETGVRADGRDVAGVLAEPRPEQAAGRSQPRVAAPDRGGQAGVRRLAVAGQPEQDRDEQGEQRPGGHVGRLQPGRQRLRSGQLVRGRGEPARGLLVQQADHLGRQPRDVVGARREREHRPQVAGGLGVAAEQQPVPAQVQPEPQRLVGRVEVGQAAQRRQHVVRSAPSTASQLGDERRTQINPVGDGNISDLSLIADEDMVITISHEGYIKRTPTTEYRSQSRGGVGSKAVVTKEEDFTEHLFTATMHNTLLAFTQKGRLYWLPVYELPEGSRTSKGRPLANFINIESDDKVRAVINVTDLKNEDYINNNYIVMCTRQGTIKKTMLEQFSRPRQNGIIAITVDEDDQLIGVCMTNGDNEIVIASSAGKAVRFHESRVRPMGRTAAGVRGISLDESDKTDHVIGMVCILSAQAQLLVVSQNGYGKRSDIDGYRITNRGAKGVGTLKVTEKVGRLVAVLDVADNDDLMIINKSGIAIRTPVNAISIIGRNTQGVRLISLRDGDEISSVTKIKQEEGEEVMSLDSEPLPVE